MDLAYTHEPCRTVMALPESRGLHLYLRTLEAAVEDDIVTDDEMSILSVIARAFALPGDIMCEAWEVLRDEVETPINASNVSEYEMRQMGDATTYQTALIAALVDELPGDGDCVKPLSGNRDRLICSLSPLSLCLRPSCVCPSPPLSPSVGSKRHAEFGHM